MIVTALFEMVLALCNMLFSWVSFPPMPSEITHCVDPIFQAIESAIGFVWLIVPRELVLVGLPIVLLVENFDQIYSVCMWVLKKIPFLGMK